MTAQPLAYARALQASEKAWQMYVDIVDHEPRVISEEYYKAHLILKHLASELYDRWQARGGLSNDDGCYTMPIQDYPIYPQCLMTEDDLINPIHLYEVTEKDE
jgi:hypothetical protein